jgi:NAD(P)-dependent dehydrogenase (short-subunit alcohol dehydrogenase family)
MTSTSLEANDQGRGTRVPVTGTALVSGAGSGSGRATARQLSREGYTIAGLDLDSAGLGETVEAIRAEGGAAASYVVDVCDSSAMAEAIERICETQGPLVALVNNAGIGVAGTVVDTSPEDWERVMAVNVTAVYQACRLAIPRMLANGHGVIVNVGSISGEVVGVRERAVYCASKAAVVGLTRTIAADYADRGIRANAICPGPVRTPWVEKMAATTADPDATLRALEQREMGTAEDIAAGIAFLAGSGGRYVNGAAFVMDGGLTAV